MLSQTAQNFVFRLLSEAHKCVPRDVSIDSHIGTIADIVIAVHNLALFLQCVTIPPQRRARNAWTCPIQFILYRRPQTMTTQCPKWSRPRMKMAMLITTYTPLLLFSQYLHHFLSNFISCPWNLFSQICKPHFDKSAYRSPTDSAMGEASIRDLWCCALYCKIWHQAVSPSSRRGSKIFFVLYQVKTYHGI